jgi:hypothetical protein
MFFFVMQAKISKSIFQLTLISLTASKTAIYRACDFLSNFETTPGFEDRNGMDVQKCKEECLLSSFVIMQVILHAFVKKK